MIRRRFLTGVVAVPLAVAGCARGARDQFSERVLAFEKHWNLFARRLFGCADNGKTQDSTCKLARGRMDFEEFAASREKAKPLFDLDDANS